MALIAFDPPERFVTGTVGPPGQRQFFLQASGVGRRTTVALEKAQVSVLTDRLSDLLQEVLQEEESAGGAQEAQAPVDNAPLDTPIEEDFRVGTMGLSWDPQRRRVIIECHAAGDSYDSADVVQGVQSGQDEIPAQDDPTQLVMRVVLAPQAAQAFARRSAAVLAAGRPPCPFCAGELDPSGHICPRANGYRR